MNQNNKTLLLLDKVPPEQYILECTERIARERETAIGRQTSVTVFECAGEHFALQTGVIRSVAEPSPIHRIPHRSDNFLLGLVNILGESELCCSLATILGLTETGDHRHLLVLGVAGESRRTESFVFPVTRVCGFHYLQPEDMQPVPDTLNGTDRFSRGIFVFNESSVNLLDHVLLAGHLRRNLR